MSHAAKGSGKITSGVNPLSGQTVKHSAKAWAAIKKTYEQRYGPLNLTGPMSPHDVATAIDAATRQKFGPQYQTLAKETSASNQQDRNVTDWYGQYKTALNNATAQSQQAQAQASGFTNQFANSSSALDATQRAQLQQQQEQSAAQRGASVDPSIAATGQQADQSRRQALGQFGALQAQTGANTTAYMADKGRIAQGSELQAHGAEATRRQGISELVRGLQGQEGDYRTTLRGQLQASERQNNLANATFGLNTQKAAASAAVAGQTAAEKAAAQREQARHNRAQEGRQTAADRRAAAKDAYQRAHHTGPYAPQRSSGGGGGGGRGGGGGQTPAQGRTWNNQFNAVYNLLQNDPPPPGTSTAAAIQNLMKHSHSPYGPTLAAYRAYLRKHPLGEANRPTQVH